MVNPIKTDTGVSVSDREAERRPAKRDSDGEGAASPPPPAAESDFQPIAPGADLRLVIERDEQGQDYIYRLIDRASGRVVAERSREQVTSIAEGRNYRAGAVVSTKA